MTLINNESNKKYLFEYKADKGCCVINNICFDNGYGDGSFNVIVSKEKPEGVEGKAWIDFRDVEKINIWGYDCDASSASWFTAADFYDAQIIEIGVKDDGNIYIWKLF